MPHNLDKLKVIGDRVLIYPDSGQDRTSSGLYLPPTVIEKELVQGGYVAVGPGTPLANTEADDDAWQQSESSKIKYIPLEIEVGDYALYLKKFAIDIKYQNEKYIIVPMSGILVVERDDESLDLSKILK